MSALQAALLVLTVASGTAVVFTAKPLRQTLMLGVHGTALALFLLALRAPDVALAQIAVGSVLVPLMFFTVIANARRRRVTDPEDGGADE